MSYLEWVGRCGCSGEAGSSPDDERLLGESNVVVCLSIAVHADLFGEQLPCHRFLTTKRHDITSGKREVVSAVLTDKGVD